jgi:hypothetical protein
VDSTASGSDTVSVYAADGYIAFCYRTVVCSCGTSLCGRNGIHVTPSGEYAAVSLCASVPVPPISGSCTSTSTTIPAATIPLFRCTDTRTRPALQCRRSAAPPHRTRRYRRATRPRRYRKRRTCHTGIASSACNVQISVCVATCEPGHVCCVQGPVPRAIAIPIPRHKWLARTGCVTARHTWCIRRN